MEVKKFQDDTSKQFICQSNWSIYHLINLYCTLMSLLWLKLVLVPIMSTVSFYSITPHIQILPIHNATQVHLFP